MARALDGRISAIQKEILLVLYTEELVTLKICQLLADTYQIRCRRPLLDVYYALNLLKTEGLVESRWGDERLEKRGGARECYYKLTQSGIVKVEELRSSDSDLLQWKPVYGNATGEPSSS